MKNPPVPPVSNSSDDALFARISARLIPLLIGLYLLAYLDRVNVGFAALQMKRDLVFSNTVYGIGAGIFFIGYALFEIPSNLILERIGARRWIARIMITWGLLSAGMAFVRTPAAFYIVRFLLGISEAGFFPGIILYLTYWFPARYQAKSVAKFMTAVAFAGIIGAPVSVAVLRLDGILHIHGWQWIFLVEGIPAVLAGVAVLWLLPDGPNHVAWLTVEDKARIGELLSHEERVHGHERASTLLAALSSGKVWQMAAVYFAFSIGLYAMGLWLPLVVKSLGHISDSRAILLSSLPYLLAALTMSYIGHLSDRAGKRGLFAFATMTISAMGFFLAATMHSLPVTVAGLCIASLGLHGFLGPFWALTKRFLGGTGAAGGIALVNSLGALGGFVGPYLMGAVKDWTHSFTSAFLLIAILFVGAGSLAFAVERRQDKSLLSSKESEFIAD